MEEEDPASGLIEKHGMVECWNNGILGKSENNF